jgi:hypothetical protein
MVMVTAEDDMVAECEDRISQCLLSGREDQGGFVRGCMSRQLLSKLIRSGPREGAGNSKDPAISKELPEENVGQGRIGIAGPAR